MSSSRRWDDVDRYIAQVFPFQDAVLRRAWARSRQAELPEIQVSENQGHFLYLLAKSMGARRILEVGTLGGYSAICLARALPAGGTLVTLEADPKHAEVARANVEEAGYAKLIQVIEGPAVTTMAKMISERSDPFDFVFIDADKPSYSEYLDLSIRLSRVGTVIIADNVVRDGEVIDADSADPKVRGVRAFNDRLAADTRVAATVVQTVGSKGYDGFAMALVVGRSA